MSSSENSENNNKKQFLFPYDHEESLVARGSSILMSIVPPGVQGTTFRQAVEMFESLFREDITDDHHEGVVEDRWTRLFLRQSIDGSPLQKLLQQERVTYHNEKLQQQGISSSSSSIKKFEAWQNIVSDWRRWHKNAHRKGR